MKSQRAVAIPEINQDHGKASPAFGQFPAQSGSRRGIDAPAGEQVAIRGLPVFHLDTANDGDDPPVEIREMSLQALGAGRLGERELRGGVDRAHMIQQRGRGRHLKQVSRTDRRLPDTQDLIEREIGGLHPGGFCRDGRPWQCRIGCDALRLPAGGGAFRSPGAKMDEAIHPLDQLRGTERLGDVIKGAEFEPEVA